MTKTQPIPCSKEEIHKLIESTREEPFYYMLFTVAKLTGRRLGELYGSQMKEEIGRKIIGNKIEFDREGKQVALAKTIGVYKKVPNKWIGGVKVEDIDLVKGTMKVWVLKRRKLEQDETILPQEAINAVRYYLMIKKLNKEDYLFREKSYRAIQEAIVRFGKKAEVNHKICFHNFRHYFVTELKRKGWSNDMIAKLTGHKTPSVLTIYDHVLAEDIREKATKDLNDI